MIRHLLLISLIFFQSFSVAKEHIVTGGDTLYSIALNYNTSLIDIYNSNKNLGLKPNSIRPGDKIYIPPKYDKSLDENCYWYSYQYEFSLERTYKENFQNCIDFLSQRIDISIFENEIDDLFWKKFNESDDYTYYVINKFLISYDKSLEESGPDSWICPDGEYGIDFDAADCEFVKSEIEKKYLAIILNAAKNDNLQAFYFWDHWEIYFEEKPRKTTMWKLVWDEYDLDYLDSISDDKIKLQEFTDEYNARFDDFCERELYQSNFKYQLKIYSLRQCLNSYGRENDVKFVEFFQNAVNYIKNNQSKFVSYNELAFVTASSHYLMNADYDDLALDIIDNFLNRICRKCNDTQDLIEDFLKYSDQNSNILGASFHYNLLALDLNYSSLQISNKNILPQDLRKIRNRSLEQYEEYFERLYDNNTSGIMLDSDTGYSMILSDFAMNLIRWGECDEASIYQDKAQRIYQNLEYDKRYSFDFWDEFNQSLMMSDCFLSQSNYDTNSLYWNSSKENAMRYVNIAESFLSEFKKQSFVDEEISNGSLVYSYVSQIDEALLKIIKLSLIIDQLSYEEITFKIKEIDRHLLSVKPEETFGFQDNMKKIESIYSKIYFYIINKYKSSDIEDLLDPIDIFNYRSNLFINNNIINLKVDASQKNLKYLQNQLQENTEKVNNIRESDFENDSYDILRKLYNDNAKIVETILTTNDNLNSILVTNLPNISEIQEKLNDDDFAIFFIDSFISENGTAILISKTSIFNYSIDSYKNINFLIRNLQLSISKLDDYDFQSAKQLYDIFFKPIEEIVPKDSTIYLLGDQLKGINPSILVKSYDASNNISQYEKLVSTNWLIEEYNVVKHFQIPSSTSNERTYDKKFLGYGNSTTYSQLGLPNLSEVNNEIKELALISNGSKDDILIDKNATKDMLFEKLELSYERIAIATHAVESFWRGLTSEPALIFNNNNDDFFLTPSEIVNLEIDTDMIILSSCSSSTEGFDDLFKSFLIAGANSVVYTNWELESKYASEFTSAFMKELWFSDLQKHQALRNTSLTFISNYEKQQYSHPAFWGNFSIAYRSL